MTKKPRIRDESLSYENQLDTIREVVNEHDERLEVLEDALPKTPEVPELPKTKEECEKAGGTWDEEAKTCKLPEKKEVVEGIGILPTSGNQGNVEARADFFRNKILGPKEEKK